MNIEQLNQEVIINEWQLGQQLNTAVHNGSREKFNLLLSFLSDDARDFAQFDLKSPELEISKENDLRSELNLPDVQPLVNAGPSEIMLVEFNDDIQQANLHDIRLKQLLVNEAVLSKTASGVLPTDVLDNLSLIKQQRIHDVDELGSSEIVGSKRESMITQGVDAHLLDDYKNLDLTNRPVQVNYV